MSSDALGEEEGPIGSSDVWDLPLLVGLAAVGRAPLRLACLLLTWSELSVAAAPHSGQNLCAALTACPFPHHLEAGLPHSPQKASSPCRGCQFGQVFPEDGAGSAAGTRLDADPPEATC